MDPLIQKIILATDFSEASRDASYHAVLLAQTYNAELKALHVFNPRPLGIPYYKAKKKDLMPLFQALSRQNRALILIQKF